MNSPEYLEAEVERAFQHILETRMRGIPVVNEALQVQAVDFHDWEGQWLGALITPWFLNLMLLPHDQGEWAGLRVGQKMEHRFPSGRYEFIVGEEEGLGRFQMCSLFSPVFEFADQEAAVATARAALAAIMDEENRDTSGFDEQAVARRWRGEPDPEPEVPPEPRKISRRAFITGGMGES